MIWNRYPQPNLSFLNFIKCAKIDRTVHLPRSIVLVFFLTFNGTIFKLCSTKNHMWLYFCHVWWFNFSFLANDGSIVTLDSTNITFDCTILTFGSTFVRMELPNVKKKKVRKPPNVTKELSHVMLELYNVRMKPSNVKKK